MPTATSPSRLPTVKTLTRRTASEQTSQMKARALCGAPPPVTASDVPNPIDSHAHPYYSPSCEIPTPPTGNRGRLAPSPWMGEGASLP